MAAGLVPLGDEPLEEDVRQVLGMLVMAGRVPPIDRWSDDARRRAAADSLAGLS